MKKISVVKVNGKPVYGFTGFLVAMMTLVFIAFIFLFIGAILLSPLWVPLLIGVLIGKAL